MEKGNTLGGRKIILIVALALIGAALLIAPEISLSSSRNESDSERLSRYSEETESKIAEICSRVQGVSCVSVTVYFESGFETVYAYNEESKATSNGVNSEKKYVTLGSGSGESMVCVVEKMPSICGVAVVCVGGGNPAVSKELINLISSTYGVPKNKIYVAEGKK